MTPVSSFFNFKRSQDYQASVVIFGSARLQIKLEDKYLVNRVERTTMYRIEVNHSAQKKLVVVAVF